MIRFAIYFFPVILLSQDAYDGYILFTPNLTGPNGGNGTATILMDNSTETIHSWQHTQGPASMPYLNPDSTIYYPYRVPNPTMNNGGVGGGIQHLTWDGEVLWEHIISDENFQHHHDIEPLPNGNVLVIAWDRKTGQEAFAMGRQSINNPLNEMWSDAILELQPDGNGGAIVVWEWYMWDHLIQDVDASLPNFGTVFEHPELMDINKGNVGSNPGAPGEPHADWLHFNAIDYNEELDQIAISSPRAGEIFIIDHSTTTEEAASHSGGNSGMGGDLLYRWGNPQNYDRGTNNDKILNGQHSINWIYDECPGAGNLILYNNHHFQGQSAVLELTPPVNAAGQYMIDVNSAFGPQEFAWMHTGDFHSSMQSGAFRQPNGNTFISVAEFAILFEVDPEGNTVWEYTHPGNNVRIARAQKYPRDYFAESGTAGDINDDGLVNVVDVVLLINLILHDGENASADMNNDGEINVLDVVLVVNIILGN